MTLNEFVKHREFITQQEALEEANYKDTEAAQASKK